MKKSLVARGITGIVASLLGVAAVGCGAATDQEAAEIGSTEQALGGTAPVVVTGKDAMSTARLFAGHCELTSVFNRGTGNQRTTNVLLVAAGLDSSGNPTFDSEVYDPVADSWLTPVAFSATNSDKRSHAQLVKVSSTECVLLGGENGTARPATTFKATMGDDGVVSWASAGSMAAGRSKFAAYPCGSGKVVALGGSNNSGVLASNDVETWDGTTTWTARASLDTAVEDFASAPVEDGTNTKFFVAGGDPASGSTTNALQAVVMNAACTSATPFTLKNGSNVTQTLTTARSQAVAFEATGSGSPRVSTFLVAAGFNGTSTAFSDSERVQVTWNATPTATKPGGATPSLATAVRQPALVRQGTGVFLLLGGLNGSGSDTVAQVSEYEHANSTSSYSSASGTLGEARFSQSAEYLSSASKLYTTGGQKLVSSVQTKLSSTEEVTP